jgi:hypothetical protein
MSGAIALLGGRWLAWGGSRLGRSEPALVGFPLGGGHRGRPLWRATHTHTHISIHILGPGPPGVLVLTGSPQTDPGASESDRFRSLFLDHFFIGFVEMLVPIVLPFWVNCWYVSHHFFRTRFCMSFLMIPIRF